MFTKIVFTFFKKSYIALIVIASILILLWTYNKYLVDRSLARLKLVLNASSTKAPMDNRALVEMLDNSLLDEVSERKLQVKTVSYIEIARDIFEDLKDPALLGDARFALERAITEKEKQRNTVLLWMDYVLLPFSSSRVSEAVLKSRARELELRIPGISDTNRLQEAYYELGGLYIRMKDYDKTRQAYSQAQKQAPGTDLADKSQFNLAWNEKFTGNLDEAVRQFESISKSAQQSEMAAFSDYQRAETYRKMGEYDKAADLHKLISEKYSGSSVADTSKLQTGYIYLSELKDYKNAEDVFGKIETVTQDPQVAVFVNKVKLPEIASKYTMRGFISLRDAFKRISENRYKLALKYFERALKISPEDSLACIGKALACCFLKKSDTALEFARKSVKLDPQSELVSSNACYIFMRLGLIDDSLFEAKRFVSVNPFSTLGYYNLGCIYAINNEFEQAADSFRKAIAINPKFASAYNNLGYCLWSLGYYNEAIKAIESAVELDPELAEIYFNLGLVYAAIGKYDDARRSLKNVISLNPHYLEAQISLSEIERIIQERRASGGNLIEEEFIAE